MKKFYILSYPQLVKIYWDQVFVALATASKTFGGQTQNLRNIIDLVSWETKLKKRHYLTLKNYSKNLMDFFKMQILTGKYLGLRTTFQKPETLIPKSLITGIRSGESI